jgi:hypothetical protein
VAQVYRRLWKAVKRADEAVERAEVFRRLGVTPING